MRGMESFTRDGLTFDVRDHAPTEGTAGPTDTGGGPAGHPHGTVVLLHGFPQDGTAFGDVVPVLVAQGLRVLVPDQRGYSPGARPHGRRPYALRELVDDVIGLLDAAGVEKAHVVGHDWGGAVAWAFASRRAARTLSLTAVSTPHPAAMVEAMRRSDQLRRSSYMLRYQVPRAPEARLLADDGARLTRLLEDSGLPEPYRSHDVARMREPGALTAALGWYRAMPVSRGFGAGVVRVPTVHVHGRHDPFFAEYGARATERFVRAPFRSVPVEAGHWLPETNPEDVADAVLSHLG